MICLPAFRLANHAFCLAISICCQHGDCGELDTRGTRDTLSVVAGAWVADASLASGLPRTLHPASAGLSSSAISHIVRAVLTHMLPVECTFGPRRSLIVDERKHQAGEEGRRDDHLPQRILENPAQGFCGDPDDHDTINQSSVSMSVWLASQPIKISPEAVFMVMHGSTVALPPFASANARLCLDQNLSASISRAVP
jgi:hypothetical protein